MAENDRPRRKLDRRGEDDVLTGRNFTADLDEFVTDAEMEAREANSSPQSDDEDRSAEAHSGGDGRGDGAGRH